MKHMLALAATAAVLFFGYSREPAERPRRSNG